MSRVRLIAPSTEAITEASESRVREGPEKVRKERHGHKKPGELRWYATLPNGNEIERADGTPFKDGHELIKPKSRTFIPARVKDNPDLRNTGYISTLQALPQPVRSQVLHGDFTAGIQDDPWQVIPTAWVEASMAH